MSKELVAWLRDAADEMRAEGEAGWPNTCDEAATVLERYRVALGHVAAFDDSENFTIRQMAKCARQALQQGSDSQ